MHILIFAYDAPWLPRDLSTETSAWITWCPVSLQAQKNLLFIFLSKNFGAHGHPFQLFFSSFPQQNGLHAKLHQVSRSKVLIKLLPKPKWTWCVRKQKVLPFRLPMPKSNTISSALAVAIWNTIGISICYMTQFWGSPIGNAAHICLNWHRETMKTGAHFLQPDVTWYSLRYGGVLEHFPCPSFKSI